MQKIREQYIDIETRKPAQSIDYSEIIDMLVKYGVKDALIEFKKAAQNKGDSNLRKKAIRILFHLHLYIQYIVFINL